MNIDRQIVKNAFENQPLVEINGRKFIINPLTEQTPATSAQLLRETANWIIETGNFKNSSKIVGEEDKGAIIVAAVSLLSNLPFGLARWYPSGLEGQQKVEFISEYANGTMYLNGIEEGDNVIIVDDMISTGGTLIALIKAIRNAGANITDVVCVGEKIEYGGVSLVEKETGCKVKTLVQISLKGTTSQVISNFGD